ncbi:MAG: DUF4293 domain-containing protein [Bacteroidetes bacterium]|nr:DUF4293 domain-containing protein [Bacteroidota bacterium]
MIQRIQTLYLSAAVIALVVLFSFPLANYDKGLAGIYTLSVSGMKYLINPPVYMSFWLTFPMLLIVVAMIILTVTSILLYKKRMTQLLLVNIAFLLNVVLIILIFIYYIEHFRQQLQLPSSHYEFGVYIPLISLVLFILANRAIRKDEVLVRSSDRLR